MDIYGSDFEFKCSSFDGRKSIVRCDGDYRNEPGINRIHKNWTNWTFLSNEFNFNGFSTIRLRQAQVAEYYGFVAASHTVPTDDGYLLTLYNIQNSSATPNGEVIFLQHGLVDTAFTWVLNLPHQSLGNNSF